MYNDTIKLLNLELFNLKIKKIDTAKRNNILYCYITLENQKEKCPFCLQRPVINGYKNKRQATACLLFFVSQFERKTNNFYATIQP